MSPNDDRLIESDSLDDGYLAVAREELKRSVEIFNQKGVTFLGGETLHIVAGNLLVNLLPKSVQDDSGILRYLISVSSLVKDRFLDLIEVRLVTHGQSYPMALALQENGKLNTRMVYRGQGCTVTLSLSEDLPAEANRTNALNGQLVNISVGEAENSYSVFTHTRHHDHNGTLIIIPSKSRHWRMLIYTVGLGPAEASLYHVDGTLLRTKYFVRNFIEFRDLIGGGYRIHIQLVKK